MIIGILGLQGCYLPHQQKFAELGIETRRVLYPEDMAGVDAMLLPGGESTTMIKTAKHGLWEALQDFARQRPVWGVCAGCILMAKDVTHPEQASLGIIDIGVARNAYGSQIQSFITKLKLEQESGSEEEVSAIFIRAPKITRLGAGLRTICQHETTPVAVESDLHMVTTFHPELAKTNAFHAYFVRKVADTQADSCKEPARS